jgi:hypothetical protein
MRYYYTLVEKQLELKVPDLEKIDFWFGMAARSAEAAAPYYHSRLSPIEQVKESHRTITYEWITPQETINRLLTQGMWRGKPVPPSITDARDGHATSVIDVPVKP